ncbi:MAG: ABC transporter ATP-binding protein [Bacteroidales bacterium]|nr:ABC transporter ATP-binding protein [Bacteroidales bacterium]
MPFLELKNVNIGYQNPIQKNINLDAYKGELIAVIGKNGSGKTTILKTIAKIIPALNGNIFVNNINSKEISISKYASLIGFSAMSSINTSNLSVYDIIRLGRTPHTSYLGKLKNKDIEAIEFAIKKTNLFNIRHKEITKISDGERQRTFIARLIAQQTEILIFDEPTAFLDVQTKHKIVSLFREIAKCSKKIVIFSTHDLKIAIQNADKLWLFDKNKIISNSPEDAILNGIFDEIFSDENILFNNFTADFDVVKTPVGQVKINSNSTQIKYIWTKNAFERLGYSISDNSKYTINVNDNNWTKNYQNKPKEYYSIYSLLKSFENDN